MPRTEHAELRKIGAKWRTIRAGTTSTLIKSINGNPVDGGGWATKDKAVGIRQVDHINQGVGKKYGRL